MLPRPEQIDKVLDLVSKGSTVQDACLAAGVLKRQFSRIRAADKEIKARFAEAWENGAEVMEAEAFRRAVTGVNKPVYQMGFEVGVVREYSDTLLIFLLKGRKPDVYRERTELTGRGGGPIEVRDARADLAGHLARIAEREKTKPNPGIPS